MKHKTYRKLNDYSKINNNQNWTNSTCSRYKPQNSNNNKIKNS